MEIPRNFFASTGSHPVTPPVSGSLKGVSVGSGPTTFPRIDEQTGNRP